MSMFIVKCTDCKFTRHVQIVAGKLQGTSGDAVVMHAFRKRHILQIGNAKYRSRSENEIELTEELEVER